MGVLQSTISKVVEDGKKKHLRHSNFHFKVAERDKTGLKRIYNLDSIVDKYREVLMQETITYELTPLEIERYRYKPRSFCQDFYANADLWSVLLRINNMLTAIDFNKPVIVTFGPKFIKTLSKLMSLEDDELEKNLERVKKI